MAEEKENKATEAEAKDAKATEAAAEKKAPAKKPAAKKPAGKTTAAKKPAGKTTAAKKPAAKKPAAKKDEDAAEARSDEATEEKAPAKKAPAKKSSTRAKKPAKETVVEPTLVKATARYVRTAPRKARLVIDHIRGESVEDARVFLQFTARHAGRDVAKVLESAIANAEHNHELSGDDLHVVKAYVDEGPTLKRWRPRAKGRATQILKRTSHITVVVSDVPSKELSKRKAAA